MTRSRVCPLVCVGTTTYYVRLRQSRRCKNSAARWQEGVSTWMLKSPSIIILAEVVQSVVRRACISGMKVELGLGGACRPKVL